MKKRYYQHYAQLHWQQVYWPGVEILLPNQRPQKLEMEFRLHLKM